MSGRSQVTQAVLKSSTPNLPGSIPRMLGLHTCAITASFLVCVQAHMCRDQKTLLGQSSLSSSYFETGFLSRFG